MGTHWRWKREPSPHRNQLPAQLLPKRDARLLQAKVSSATLRAVTIVTQASDESPVQSRSGFSPDKPVPETMATDGSPTRLPKTHTSAKIQRWIFHPKHVLFPTPQRRRGSGTSTSCDPAQRPWPLVFISACLCSLRATGLHHRCVEQGSKIDE